MQVSTVDYTQQLNQAVQWILSSHLPPQEKVLIILLLRNGLRVSEISDSSSFRVIDKWSVSIYSSKNKVWRTVTTAEAAELIEQYDLKDNLHTWKRNRFYYYRLLKGLLPDIESQRTGNTAVTHAARNARAQMTYEATGNPQATSASIGNRSIKATSRYVRKQAARAFIQQGIESNPSGTVGNVQVTKTRIIRKPKGCNNSS